MNLETVTLTAVVISAASGVTNIFHIVRSRRHREETSKAQKLTVTITNDAGRTVKYNGEIMSERISEIQDLVRRALKEGATQDAGDSDSEGPS
jgi:hypothetical protein